MGVLVDTGDLDSLRSPGSGRARPWNGAWGWRWAGRCVCQGGCVCFCCGCFFLGSHRVATEEPGRLQSVGSHRVRHDLAIEHECTQLTVVAMLYVTSPGLICCINGSLYLLIPFTYFVATASNRRSLLCVFELGVVFWSVF